MNVTFYNYLLTEIEQTHFPKYQMSRIAIQELCVLVANLSCHPAHQSKCS